MTEQGDRKHREEVLRINTAEDVREALGSHRLAYAEDGKVACYCSAGQWRSLDGYGRHLESLLLECEEDPHDLGLIDRTNTTNKECQ